MAFFRLTALLTDSVFAGTILTANQHFCISLSCAAAARFWIADRSANSAADMFCCSRQLLHFLNRWSVLR